MNTPRKDPWHSFMVGHYYQILRTLVGVSCGMTGKRYLRAERLLRRFRQASEARLKAYVLEDLRDEWRSQKANGSSLEQVLENKLTTLRRKTDGGVSSSESDAATESPSSSVRPSQSPPPQVRVRVAR
jgi:hypothetical protein